MRTQTQSIVIATGFAMFAMFFGAGNIVFPLVAGQHAASLTPFALMGLLITAVGVPFLGLIAIILYDGDYRHFFAQLGAWPGFIIAAIIMGLIGPFGAIPRCIALSYSTTKMYFPGISLHFFSITSCILIYFLSVRKNRILDLLGFVLTPFLIATLIIIVLKGLLEAESMPISKESPLTMFFYGINEGYQTMDLLGAFFFSSVVINGLKSDLHASSDPKDLKKVVYVAFKASFIGAALLALVYSGFSFIAAYNADMLKAVPADEMLGTLSKHILGNYAGFIATLCVALACLTTAMALAAVFAEFVHKDLTAQRISYTNALLITLVITYFVSTLHFTGIAALLMPILQICYPAMIVLSLANLAHKLTGFNAVKPLVFGTLALTLGVYLLAWYG